jgi:hypothetical protein
LNWTAAPEKDLAAVSRLHSMLLPVAIKTAIDKLPRNRTAMRRWRETEQISMLSPTVYD